MNIEPAKDRFRWVIAATYYDGAISGIAKAAQRSTCVYFQMVAWDDNNSDRVFACATVDCALIQRFRRNLETIGPGQEPFWLPGKEHATPQTKAGWLEIRSVALDSTRWELVSGQGLLGSVQSSTNIDPKVTGVS